MKYSIVIPTYNKCNEFLKPCVESILKYTNLADIELIISANGCTDDTKSYIDYLRSYFDCLYLSDNFKYIWNDSPLGYSKSTNLGILYSTGEYIILLNNDTVLLEQNKNLWIELLTKPFKENSNCGISGPLISYSPEIDEKFIIFFCAMIDRKVFANIGLLNEEFGIGSGEDIEFCLKAKQSGFSVVECAEKQLTKEGLFTGIFPIYHRGEGTMLDESLVKNYREVFKKNHLHLAKKYNIEHYKLLLTNNFERHVNLADEEVPSREAIRYKWAAARALRGSILEIGCSSGFGSQFFHSNVDYTGVDYDREIIEVARVEFEKENRKFEWADINTYDLKQYDTIVAFEVIEHLENGLEIVEKLKNHCNTLLISVPYKEPPGFWGEHHKLHMLDESHLPGFKYTFCDEHGNLADTLFENSRFNLMLCEYNAK